MKRASVISFVCVTTLAVSLLGAQQQATAQRPENIRGTIASVEPGRIVIDENGTNRDIVLNEQTRYRRVNTQTLAFEDVKRDEVQPGFWATVSNLRDGDTITARFVFFAPTKDQLDDAFLKRREDARRTAATATATAPATTRAVQPPQDPTVPAPRVGARLPFFMEKHESFLARARQGQVDVLFLGDSITQGWTKAQELWDARYAPLNAANFGISGDCTQHVLWRLENGELDGISPKVVVLMIGTNNSGNSAAEPIAEGITRIVRSIHEKSPRSKVLLLGVFPRTRATDGADRMDKINRINQIISKLDDGGKTVRYLNINDKLTGPDGKVPTEIMPDGLHPNARGYQIWADAMQPTLEQMLKS